MPIAADRGDFEYPPDHYVVIIADWESDISRHITIQDFIQDGEAFIPVFSDVERFREEAAGSGFEDKGVLIKKDFLAQLLHGDEVLILNPGSAAPRRMTSGDLL
jgi:hypothetical protein